MGEIDAQVAELRAIRAELARIVDRYPGEACQDATSGRWWCEQEFSEQGTR